MKFQLNNAKQKNLLQVLFQKKIGNKIVYGINAGLFTKKLLGSLITSPEGMSEGLLTEDAQKANL